MQWWIPVLGPDRVLRGHESALALYAARVCLKELPGLRVCGAPAVDGWDVCAPHRGEKEEQRDSLGDSSEGQPIEPVKEVR